MKTLLAVSEPETRPTRGKTQAKTADAADAQKSENTTPKPTARNSENETRAMRCDCKQWVGYERWEGFIDLQANGPSCRRFF